MPIIGFTAIDFYVVLPITFIGLTASVGPADYENPEPDTLIAFVFADEA